MSKRIKLRGSPRRGQVIEVIIDPDKADWSESSPKFIKVKMDDGPEMVVNPRQLKARS